MAVWVGAALFGCERAVPAAASGEAALSVEALQDPETCRPCHTQHYLEWESSMHAYAAKDPVFTAMNERGQRETGGELGEFCVKCHAPMAQELGMSSDGLNLPKLTDPNTRGVTCYFCHNVVQVTDDHNRGVMLAHDGVMRGGLGPRPRPDAREPANAKAPMDNAAHASAYSELHDSASASSAAMCGGCHDIVNDNGVAIERTFVEWKQSHFSSESELKTCASCHMPTYTGRAAPGAPMRTLHRHMWAGVDTALTKSYPGVNAQSAAIDCAFEGALELDIALAGATTNFDRFVVTLTNRAVGHAWPSGSAQDRRAWVEFVAYDADEQIVFDSGVVEPGRPVGGDEPELHVLRDALHDENGEHVHMFWEAAPSRAFPDGYESALLAVPEAPGSSKRFDYALPAPAVRVTARVQLQAIGLDVIDDFAGMDLPLTEQVLADVYKQGGDLRSRIRTITVPGTSRELRWLAGQAVQSDVGSPPSGCVEQAYASQLYP